MKTNYRKTFINSETRNLARKLEYRLFLLEPDGGLVIESFEGDECYHVPNLTDEDLMELFQSENYLSTIRTWEPVVYDLDCDY